MSRGGTRSKKPVETRVVPSMETRLAPLPIGGRVGEAATCGACSTVLVADSPLQGARTSGVSLAPRRGSGAVAAVAAAIDVFTERPPTERTLALLHVLSWLLPRRFRFRPSIINALRLSVDDAADAPAEEHMVLLGLDAGGAAAEAELRRWDSALQMKPRSAGGAGGVSVELDRM